MNQYTIYCTAEQTKKALELGAPLKFIPMFRYGDNSLPKFVHKNRWNRDEFCYCPTTEQMIGWLEEQKSIREIYVSQDLHAWSYSIFNDCWEEISLNDESFSTRKEATLAVISAALDCLTKAMEE